VVRIAQFAKSEAATLLDMASNRQDVLLIRCPTCGVGPNEECKLITGELRNGPHRDRRIDVWETDSPRE
jgi:hypothetical protein